MRAMKDSGIPWIGEVPANWDLRRMKTCIKSRVSGAWGNEPKGDDGDIVCLRIADYDYERFAFKNIPIEDLTVRNYDLDTIQKLLLRKGDILIEKSGGGEKTPVGRTVIFDKDYPALYANFMDCLRCASAVTNKWMQYVFVTFYKNDYTRNYIKQTTGIQNLDLTSMLASERVPVPGVDEQEKITGFLDAECARIDVVIEQTRASIEEYKKLKQSIITEAVTKGIRSNRPMKDSGIDWIGQIPADWEISKIKHVSLFQPSCDTSCISEDSTITYTPMECIKNGYFINNVATYGSVAASLTPFNNGDIVIAKVTPCFENGNIAIMENLYSGFGLGSSELFVLRPKGINTRFLFYWLQNNLFMQQARATMTGTGGLKRVSPYFIRNCSVALPHETEQKEIVTSLDAQTRAIDSLISKKEQSLFDLEAYKKSMIYEFVTGKKEVLEI